MARACRELVEDFVQLMLARIDLHLPRWVLSISDLVSVEQKSHFAHELMPALLERLTDGSTAETEQWLGSELAAYGKDARVLIGPGVAAFIARHQPACGETLARLFELDPS